MIEAATSTGTVFDLENPLAEKIFVNDILTSLEGVNRFNGHTRYSNLQHSCVVTELCESEEAKPYAILHDVKEVYMCDITRPTRRHLCKHEPTLNTTIRNLENNLDAIIWEAFGLEPPSLKIQIRVTQADNLANNSELKWLLNYDTGERYLSRINFRRMIPNPQSARGRFMNHIMDLCPRIPAKYP